MLWISLMMVCLVAGSCSEDKDDTLVDSVHLYTTSISATAEQGEQSVTICTTRSWTAQSDAEWLTVDQPAGGTGFTAVHVAWTTNTTGEARVGHIRFTPGSYSDQITVTQAAK